MSIVSGIVLFAVVWFLVLFIVLPIRLETQGDRGEVLSGTHASAPANLSMKRKALITTGVAILVWALLVGGDPVGRHQRARHRFLRAYGATVAAR